MAKQNRVTPTGTIEALPDRGLFTGNRGGALHNEQHQIVKSYHDKRWLICDLEYKEVKAKVMAPGLYTHLFFLDEATALAAGHRPCYLCRFDAWKRFRDAWRSAHRVTGQLKTDDVDKVLHEERTSSPPRQLSDIQKTHTCKAGTLPNGSFILLDERPHLVWQRAAYPGAHQAMEPPQRYGRTTR